jgi:hypothetical protein
MELRKSSRKKAKIRLGLQGPSGSGKTYSSLLIAFGLCGNWSKISVIDTEANSADLYSHLGEFNVINISEPFSPEKYLQAIQVCEEAGSEVIIIDSMSHEWEGPGGILDIHSKLTGNSFTNWGKLTPRHNAFVQGMLHSKAHLIGTIRTKHDYILTEKNGKQVPEKVGLKAIQRENLEYDFTLVFDLDIKNNANAYKDRTGLFFGKGELRLSESVGKSIRAWCDQGTEPNREIEALLAKIEATTSIDELVSLFKDNPGQQELMLPHFTKKRNEIGKEKTIVKNIKSSSNGNIITK